MSGPPDMLYSMSEGRGKCSVQAPDILTDGRRSYGKKGLAVGQEDAEMHTATSIFISCSMRSTYTCQQGILLGLLVHAPNRGKVYACLEQMAMKCSKAITKHSWGLCAMFE